MKLTLLSLFSISYGGQAQSITFEGRGFELSHVKATVNQLNGEGVLRVERDLEKGSSSFSRIKPTPLFWSMKCWVKHRVVQSGFGWISVRKDFSKS